MKKQSNTENRVRQIAVGGGIIFLFMSAVICLLAFWRYVPGWVGESVGLAAGLISTPFFLEATFILMGLGIVISLNSWRRRKDGDDFILFDEQGARMESEDSDVDR
jgi:hypothetical protein